MKLFLIGFVLVSVSLSWAKSPKDVLATVNGQPITRAEFEEYHIQNLKFIGQRKINKEISLDDLIKREVGIQTAKKNGLTKDPKVIKLQEDILYHAQISNDLEKEFQKITVSDQDVKKYYENNKEYRTAHILYRLRAEPTPQEVTKALEQSVALFEEIKNEPESFGKMANKFSQTSAAAVGGDLGFQPPTRLAPEYFEAIKGKAVGYISPPIRTAMGYHIIKVLGIKSYDQIEVNMYKKIIYDQKRDAILENYFKKLKSGASIKINKDLL